MVVLLGFENLFMEKGFDFSLLINTVIRGIWWGSNIPSRQLMSVGVMWFLFVFFWSKLLFDLLQLCTNDYANGIILFILCIAMYFLSKNPAHWLPQALDLAPFGALFMWMGSYWRKVKDSKMLNKTTVIISLIVMFIYWAVCVKEHVYIELSIRHYPYFLVCLIEAFAGTALMALLSTYIERFVWSNYIKIIGHHTLAIMCIHHLDLYWIFWGAYFHSWPVAAVVRLCLDLIILCLFLLISNRIKQTRTN